MKPVALLTAAFALSSCVTGPNVGSGVRSDGLATLGGPTRVGPLVVTPMSVIEDSRCPINARCVWAGRLILQTRIQGAGWCRTVELTLGNIYRTHSAGLALVSAEPGKIAGAEQAQPANLFGFESR